MSSNIIVKFGKYKGQTLDIMLNDVRYTSWVKTTDIPQKYPDIYDYLFPKEIEPPVKPEPSNVEPDIAPSIEEVQQIPNDESESENSETTDSLMKKIQMLEEDNQRLRSEVMRLKLMLKGKI